MLTSGSGLIKVENYCSKDPQRDIITEFCSEQSDLKTSFREQMFNDTETVGLSYHTPDHTNGRALGA